MATQTVLIVGTGSVGRFLDGEVRRIGWKTRLLGRGDPVTDIAEPVLVFFTVKAFDLEAAFRDVLAHLPSDSTVVVLPNGLLATEIKNAEVAFPKLVFVRGIVTFGVTEKAGSYERVGQAGRCFLGTYGGLGFPSMLQDLVRAGEREESTVFEVVTDISIRERDKWILNTVVNTITAARRLPRNGDLVLHGALTTTVFGEACRIASRLMPDLPLDIEKIHDRLTHLIIDTADNENSMARDVRLGRKTEAAFFSGKANPETEPVLAELHRSISSGR